MLPHPDAVRPLSIQYDDSQRVVVHSGADDLIGTVAELKHHASVEHSLDDDYLGRLLGTARRMVGDYTRWPMRWDTLSVAAVWPWRAHGLRRLIRGTGERPCRLLLPGPVDPAANVWACRYHGGELDPDTQLTDIAYLPRLPHDAVVTLPDDFEVDTDDGQLHVAYTVSWSSIYAEDLWPADVAHTLYRVASTLYLYREATVMGDQPLKRIMASTLGPYVPVVV